MAGPRRPPEEPAIRAAARASGPERIRTRRAAPLGPAEPASRHPDHAPIVAPGAVAGGDGLTGADDRQVLFALLARALPWVEAAAAAEALLARYKSLADAVAAPVGQVAAVPGVGPVAAALLGAARAIAVRLAAAPLRERPLLNNWTALQEYLTLALGLAQLEHVRVLFLDTRNHLIADEEMGTGTVNHAPVYPREIARRCLEVGATAAILVHNHPSGSPRASEADLDMTRQVRDALAAIGVALHDHLIVVRGGVSFSFRRDGGLL